MALLDDGALAKTIAQALGGVMGSVTLSRTTTGGYNPDTGTVEPGTTETWTVRGMVEDFSASSLQKSQAFLDGSIITPGDRKCTLLAHGLAITPQPGDTITVGGRDHRILSITSDPAGATWNLLIR